MQPRKLIAILAAGALFAGTAGAAEPVATAEVVEGSASLERQGAASRLAAGAALYEGDRIKTAADGRVELAMRDGSRLTLTALGNLTISRYLVSEKEKTRQSSFELLSGRLRAYVSKLGAAFESNTWQIRTPTAVAGVRGTDFFVFIREPEDGEGESETEVFVEEGEVGVESSDPSIEGTVVLGPGQYSRVVLGGPPAAAQQAAAGMRDRVRKLMSSIKEREAESRRSAAQDAGGAGGNGGGEGGGAGGGSGGGEPGGFGDDGADLPPFQQVPSTLPGGGGPDGPLPPQPQPGPAILDIDVRVNDTTAP